jgi:hypothetical protein
VEKTLLPTLLSVFALSIFWFTVSPLFSFFGQGFSSKQKELFFFFFAFSFFTFKVSFSFQFFFLVLSLIKSKNSHHTTRLAFPDLAPTRQPLIFNSPFFAHLLKETDVGHELFLLLTFHLASLSVCEGGLLWPSWNILSTFLSSS